MSYLVFARKYRPQTFEDVVAQEHVTRTLKNAVARDRIGSGYLFCGPRGTGKTTTARILAKALNCVNGPTPTPCGECDSCKEITAGSSMDVLEIDAASNTGVDDVRQLRENVRYLPSGGKKRIYIIDEVHRLSGAAFDALLKTLEEPPDHVLFLFATTEPLKVPDTILSRTQRFDFKRVSAADLADHLKRIADNEGLTIDETALAILARKADGSVRDSLSLMDQIAAYAGETVSEADVVEALGLVDRSLLFSFTNAVADHQPGQALELVRQILEAGVDVADFIDELMEHFRIVMVLSADDKSDRLMGLGETEISEYRDQAAKFALGDVLRLIKITADLNVDLRGGMDERLLLEVAAVKGIDPETEEAIERPPDPEAPLAALAFKIQTDPYLGKLAWLRIYSGTLAAGGYVLNATREKKQRLGRLHRMHSNKRGDVEEARAGDIVAAAGFKAITTGDTICDPGHPVLLEQMNFPEPVIGVAIEPKTKADEEKLADALQKLSEEDPTFQVKVDDDTGQLIISGM